MNIRDLKYVLAVADEKHFGRASQRCFVSQPTLSGQIKKLEAQLGVTIFERGTRHVQVTEVGEEIVQRAQEIVAASAELEAFAEQHRDPLAGRFRLGLIHTCGPYILPQVMPSLRLQLPDLECLLVEGQTDHLISKLEQGELDAAVLALPVENERFMALPLFEEPFLLAVPESHSLSNHQVISVEDLPTAELLLLEDGHCLADQALSFCEQHGGREQADAVRSNFRATSLETLRQMVIAGNAVSVFPALAATQTPGVIFRHFVGSEPERCIGLVMRKHSARKIACLAVAACIQKALAGLDEIRLTPGISPEI